MPSAAFVVARRSKGPPALSTPLRTVSPVGRPTGSASPVSADSSSVATPAVTIPSAGTTSPGATISRSPGTISVIGTVSSNVPRYRRAVRGARASSACRSRWARSAAQASSARPLASMTAITAAASSSRTATAPASASTAMTSTPSRPRRTLAAVVHSAYPSPVPAAVSHTTSRAVSAPARAAAPPTASPTAVRSRNSNAERLASHFRIRGRTALVPPLVHAERALRRDGSQHIPGRPALIGRRVTDRRRPGPVGIALRSGPRREGAGWCLWLQPSGADVTYVADGPIVAGGRVGGRARGGRARGRAGAWRAGAWVSPVTRNEDVGARLRH